MVDGPGLEGMAERWSSDAEQLDELRYDEFAGTPSVTQGLRRALKRRGMRLLRPRPRTADQDLTGVCL
jgi:hypothetical protein